MAERPNIKRQQIEPPHHSGAVWRLLHGCRGSTTKQAECYPVAREWEKQPQNTGSARSSRGSGPALETPPHGNPEPTCHVWYFSLHKEWPGVISQHLELLVFSHPHAGSSEEDGHRPASPAQCSQPDSKGMWKHGGERGQDVAANPTRVVLSWQRAHLSLQAGEKPFWGG